MARFATEVHLRAIIRDRHNGRFTASELPLPVFVDEDSTVGSEVLDAPLLESEVQDFRKPGEIVLVFELGPGFAVSVAVPRLALLSRTQCVECEPD